eukprot:TRINITY_DN2349_c0_g1_i4.p1 TRINITY_DN2349_c0_g1~~TRINITY_DN2349_c0_g1_i4.p1  ORF type:complete len:645 (+),score=153.34 TRINITY_DN2349_c0_g1_i4:80-2014(+)
MEAKITEPAASTAVSQLEAALRTNGIQVHDGVVQGLLDQRQWIYPSERVEKMMEKLNEAQLYSVFNSQHHLQSSALLFTFLASMRKKVSVVYGHKAQGKTQFLFFLFKLLQAMGEKVLFLDKSIMPSKRSGKIDVTNSKFCGHLWRDDFLRIGVSVKDTLDLLFRDADPKSFGEFLDSLVFSTRQTGTRIWIIVDEVVLFENFPIDLPEEQDLGPFNWIVTGSAGIGSWVAKKHLEKLVFDLPLFTKEECFEFANNLCNSLDINLATGIDGVPLEGIDDWLEERFGGVVGYIAEMFLEISKGSSVSQYMSNLDERVNEIISNSAERRHISNKQLAEDWLNEIKSSSNRWKCFRDAGLCGSSAPRGIIFSLILKWLYTFFPEEDALSLVHRFRVKFRADPGLDGCLLELEEILKLKANNSFQASLLTLDGHNWIAEECLDLPSRPSDQMSVFQYVEDDSMLDEILIPGRSQWNLIQVPSGFDVIDVVLVDVSATPAIYGIQITRSVKPFVKHHTFDTCLPRSQERLETLWNVISDHFDLDDSVEVFYVMLAPNCERDEFKPPGGHESDCYFAPARIITKYEPSTSRKRRSHPVPARPPPSKKKCCKCRSGKCTNCQCVKKKRQCHPKCQCHLKGDQKGIEADTEE